MEIPTAHVPKRGRVISSPFFYPLVILSVTRLIVLPATLFMAYTGNLQIVQEESFGGELLMEKGRITMKELTGERLSR
jgi:hypothetical protein